jgi:hypothetical protein
MIIIVDRNTLMLKINRIVSNCSQIYISKKLSELMEMRVTVIAKCEQINFRNN